LPTSSACRLLISGRVQGVSFRYYMREAAQKLGVSGWCRNLSDGRVEALVCGSPEQLTAMQDWAWQGPPEAVVEQVDVSPAEEEKITSFEIRQ